MPINRREFVKASAMAGAGLLLAGGSKAFGYSVSMPLKKFVVPLPVFGGPGALDIPLAKTAGTPYQGVDYYEVTAGMFRQQLHPALPNPTRLYGYSTSGVGPDGMLANARHLGAALLATMGKPVRMRLKNALPPTHILPFDSSIPSPGNGGSRQDRAAIHLHGGLVPWTSDGGPFHWTAAGTDTSYESLMSKSAAYGSSVIPWLPDVNGRPTFDYYYPNNQSARLMWYHDHAVGITRLNAYAGLATGYLVMDPDDVMPFGEVLVFQDKVFWDPAADPDYTNHVTGALPGDLWYPYLYEKQLWKLSGANNAKQGAVLPVASSVAEMFGDTMLVNGVVYPYTFVNPRKTRLRMLNACNGRFLNLSFMIEDPHTPGEPLLDKTSGLPLPAPVEVWQIGNESGYLPAKVNLFDANGNGRFPSPLLLGPAERADIIIDFTHVPDGMKVILYNDAPAPFPGGNATFDYHLGVRGVMSGYGPNTRTLLQLQKDTSQSPVDIDFAEVPEPVLPTVPDTISGGLKVDAATLATMPAFANYTYIPPESGQTKELTLNEAFDDFGRLMQLVGTNVATGGGFGRAYLSTPTESVKYGTIEIWNVYNLTADAHPMHFHLFNVMVLCRRPFRVNQFGGSPIWTAGGRGPDPTECGWKETVKMFPGECTTVAVLVDDPMPVGGSIGRDKAGRPTVTVTPSPGGRKSVGSLPFSPRLKTFGVADGEEYVWHCHILEHEEHDMMRPLVGVR